MLVPAPVGDVLVEPNLDPDDDVTVLHHRFGALQKPLEVIFEKKP